VMRRQSGKKGVLVIFCDNLRKSALLKFSS
jgi:hypothetical protein